MEKLVVTGPTSLKGEVTISGAKNAAVAILPATLLINGTCIINNLPNIVDVKLSCEILEGLGAKIKWLDKNSMENILKSARCLVFPSNWYECQPLVVLECLAKGIPCISSKICASSESLINGKTGLLFENNNKNDLKIAMSKIKDDEINRIMSNTAYNDFWNKDYSLKKYISEIIRIYGDFVCSIDSDTVFRT